MKAKFLKLREDSKLTILYLKQVSKRNDGKQYPAF